jgi:hypothetical protein
MPAGPENQADGEFAAQCQLNDGALLHPLTVQGSCVRQAGAYVVKGAQLVVRTSHDKVPSITQCPTQVVAWLLHLTHSTHHLNHSMTQRSTAHQHKASLGVQHSAAQCISIWQALME